MTFVDSFDLKSLHYIAMAPFDAFTFFSRSFHLAFLHLLEDYQFFFATNLRCLTDELQTKMGRA